MAMDTTITIASAVAGLNILMLAALVAVWVRNYRTFRTPLILGLIVFGLVMAVENAMAIYFFFSTKMLYAGTPGVQQAVMVLRGLQLVALAFLTWVTMK